MERPRNPEEVTEWIDRYISGEMDGQECTHFEAAVLEDYDLAAQLEEQICARNLLEKVFQEERLRGQIRAFQKQEKKEVFVRKLVKYTAAACLVIMTGLSFMITSMPVFPDSENDFTVIRGEDESVMRPDRKVVFDRFFDGQAHIAEGQYASAVKDFEQVLGEEDLRSYFREAAEWHLIVAYLKSGNLNKANDLYKQFNNCTGCEYEVSKLNRWKIWLQIQCSRALS